MASQKSKGEKGVRNDLWGEVLSKFRFQILTGIWCIYIYFMWTRNRAISTGNFVSQLKLDMNFFWAEGLGNIRTLGVVASGGLWWLSTILLGGGPHPTDTFINESNLLLGRCLHLFTILFLRKPHFYVFGGSQFCQLWTWHVFFLLDLKPRTRNGYVCLKRNDFPQRRARKGEHFRARRNWCLCGPSLWDIPQNVVVW